MTLPKICPNSLKTQFLKTYIVHLNGQVEYGAIESYDIPCGGAVILHHTKTHGHRFNVWTKRNKQKYKFLFQKHALFECVMWI